MEYTSSKKNTIYSLTVGTVVKPYEQKRTQRKLI